MREFMQIKFKIRQNRVTENRSVPHPPITGGLTWNYLWKGGTWELSGTMGKFYLGGSYLGTHTDKYIKIY